MGFLLAIIIAKAGYSNYPLILFLEISSKV